MTQLSTVANYTIYTENSKTVKLRRGEVPQISNHRRWQCKYHLLVKQCDL